MSEYNFPANIDEPSAPAPIRNSSKYQQLLIWLWRLRIIMLGLLVLSLIGLLSSWLWQGSYLPYLPLLSALLTLSTTLTSLAYQALQERTRRAGIDFDPRPAWWSGVFAVYSEDSEANSFLERLLDRVDELFFNALDSIGTDTLTATSGGLLALVLVLASGAVGFLPVAVDGQLYVFLGFLIALSFCLLVVERMLSFYGRDYVEAKNLGMSLRPVITGLVLLAMAIGIFRQPNSLSPYLLWLPIGIIAIMALELLGRAVFALFRPGTSENRQPLDAKTFLAEFWQWPPSPLLSKLFDYIRRPAGVNLHQIWAVNFLLRAAIPVLGIMLVAGWLLTSLQQVSFNERGIYERFGIPVEVKSPGLHVILPWPWGRLVKVENGQVNQLSINLADPGITQVPVSAEGPAPSDANRLWDMSHPSELSQVIASKDNDPHGIQVINMDVRFFYRIDDTPEAIINAHYQLADIPRLVQSFASQILVHTFANHTLTELLGIEREGVARAINKQLQDELDQHKTGIRILATTIEAFHPPPAAAAAFHQVQATEIQLKAELARERGNALATHAAAQQQATALLTSAEGKAKEVAATAEQNTIGFVATVDASKNYGTVFMLERYYKILKDLLPSASLSIIDQHLQAAQKMIDLRNFNNLLQSIPTKTPEPSVSPTTPPPLHAVPDNSGQILHGDDPDFSN